MVQPLTLGSAAFAGSPVTPEPVNTQFLSDAAVQVPPTAAATNSNPAGDNRAGLSQGRPDNPQPSSLDKAIEQLNAEMQAWSTGMRFEIDDDTQRVVVSIIDTSSGDVLRTVPSDAVLRVAKMIIQFQGNTVNTQA